jgi:hypothetical protein
MSLDAGDMFARVAERPPPGQIIRWRRPGSWRLIKLVAQKWLGRAPAACLLQTLFALPLRMRPLPAGHFCRRPRKKRAPAAGDSLVEAAVELGVVAPFC